MLLPFLMMRIVMMILLSILVLLIRMMTFIVWTFLRLLCLLNGVLVVRGRSTLPLYGIVDEAVEVAASVQVRLNPISYCYCWIISCC